MSIHFASFYFSVAVQVVLEEGGVDEDVLLLWQRMWSQSHIVTWIMQINQRSLHNKRTYRRRSRLTMGQTVALCDTFYQEQVFNRGGAHGVTHEHRGQHMSTGVPRSVPSPAFDSASEKRTRRHPLYFPWASCRPWLRYRYRSRSSRRQRCEKHVTLTNKLFLGNHWSVSGDELLLQLMRQTNNRLLLRNPPQLTTPHQ